MASLLGKVSSAVAGCARRVSRATRRPRRARQLVPADHQEAGGGEDVVGEGGLWRRAILMGERCKPLDFPGAIHYDSFGRLLPAAPAPRGGGGKAAAGALLCRSSDAVDEAVRATKKAERV